MILLSVFLLTLFVSLFIIVTKSNNIYVPYKNTFQKLPYSPRQLYQMDRKSQREKIKSLYKDICPKGFTIAFKGFNNDMTCRDFKYKEGERYVLKGEPKCCQRGFHACLYLPDCFLYYSNSMNNVFHIVFVKDYVGTMFTSDSKICAKEIIIGPKLYLK